MYPVKNETTSSFTLLLLRLSPKSEKVAKSSKKTYLLDKYNHHIIKEV